MPASTRGRAARLVLATAVVVAATLASAAAPPVAAADRDTVPPEPAAQVGTDRADGAGNNTTAIHQDPAAVAPERTAPALQAYLVEQMSGTLRASSENLTLRDYDRAERLLDREYEANLSRYRDVAVELDEEETAALYEELGTTQRAVIEDARAAERLGRQYAAAERNGSDARARRLARRLVNRSRAISANTTRLAEAYERASNETGRDYSAEVADLSSFRRRVANASARVRAREFDSTTLAVEANRSTAAFTRPVRITGRLATANGEPVANRPITLGVGAQEHTVETNATGGFALVYRPVLAPTNESDLTVRYLPDDTALYLPTNATTPLRIRQTEATLTDVRATTPVAFEETLRVRGAVEVRGERVADVPLRVLVGETRLATTDLGANGTFRARATVPAGVPSGTRQLVVRGPANRAVRVDATRPIEVAETPTTLTGSVARRNASRAVVTGEFTAGDGRALSNRTLRVTVGRTVRTVETDADGAYAVRVDLRLGMLDTPRDRVRVVHRGAGSNLARASATVPIPPRPTATSFDDLDELTLAQLVRVVLFSEVTLGAVGLAAGAGLLGAAVRLYRRRDDAPADASATTDEPAADTSTRGDDAPPGDASAAGGSDDTHESVDPDATALDGARRALSTGATDAAVLRSYGAVWAVLRGLCDADAPTHWGLYAAVAGTGRVPSGPLRRLTETYERTAYGDGSADRAAADEALADAEAVLAGLDSDALQGGPDPGVDARPPGHGAADPDAE